MSEPTRPLAGKYIVVTRPERQAEALTEKITLAGGNAVAFPLLKIDALDDETEIRQQASRLADYVAVIFISPNAVSHSVPVFLAQTTWPGSTLAISVGPGTTTALADHGIEAIQPETRFDSEALLQLPQLAAERVVGQRILIVRGNGGRPLLGDQLRARGAKVDYLEAYRRKGPDGGDSKLIDYWRSKRLDALIVSSSEALHYLLEMLDDEGLAYLRQTPIFVPHQRIRDTAQKAHLDRVILTAPADDGLFEGLCAYNWQSVPDCQNKNT